MTRLLALVTAALLAACSSLPGADPSPSPSATATGPTVRIGMPPEEEARLLAHVLAELAAEGGFRPVLVERDDTTAARQALVLGDVDVLASYTGQVWLEVLGRANPPGDPRASFAQVRNADESQGLLWLRPAFELELGADGAPANATFGLFTRGLPSIDADLRTLEQLASRLPERPDSRICVDPDFGQRPDGWADLADAYAIARRDVVSARPVEAIRGVAGGDCLVGLASATDGAAWGYGLQLLDDPLRVFPAFVVAAVVRAEVRAGLPGLVAALDPFAAHLTTRRLGTWNARLAAGDALEVVAADAAAELLAARDAATVPVVETSTPAS